ncbi:MAG: serine protease [Streptomycetaceae bacterium]|nr:serine protease [Streptomycetaceae bacterium]
MLDTHAEAIRRLADRWLGLVSADPAVRDAQGDFACSPTGLWLALGAVAAGARGATADELRELLGVAGEAAAPAVTKAARELAGTDALAVATAAWARVPTYRAYRKGLPDVFFGNLEETDDANAAIDAWVRKATGGLIEKLPVEPESSTLLVLVNALALKARWEEPFALHATRERPFTDAAGATHQVPTMYRGVPVADVWRATHSGSMTESTVVELRCRAESRKAAPARVRFVLGPPGASAVEVLPAAWADVARRRAVQAESAWMTLPRLSLRTKLSVLGHLGALGVSRAQTNEADFSGMSPEPLAISQVVQESLIRVAEKGVEAAAVTVVTMFAGGAAWRPAVEEQVVFDRPFGIVVLDGTGEIPVFVAWQASRPAGDPIVREEWEG